MELSAKALEKVDDYAGRYPEKRSALLMVLHTVQDDQGYISKEAIEWIAEKLELEPINVYEVVTFYPMFRQAPRGKKLVKVCRTLSCALRGSYKVCENLKKDLNCDEHGNSPDGEFTVEFVECIASCGTAPVVQVNEKLHEDVTPEKVEAFIKMLKEDLEDKVEATASV